MVYGIDLKSIARKGLWVRVPPRAPKISMADIKEFKPSTVERPKPEKPDDVFDIEEHKKTRKVESLEISSNLVADAYDLLQADQLTKEEIDNLKSLTDNERTLLKISADLLWGMKQKDKTIKEQQELLEKLKHQLWPEDK